MMRAADLPQYYNMSEILAHNLPERSHKMALYSAERSITFQEASDEVNRVGNALKPTLSNLGRKPLNLLDSVILSCL